MSANCGLFAWIWALRCTSVPNRRGCSAGCSARPNDAGRRDRRDLLPDRRSDPRYRLARHRDAASGGDRANRHREEVADPLEGGGIEREVGERAALLARDDAGVEQLLEVVADRRLLEVEHRLQVADADGFAVRREQAVRIFTRCRSASALKTVIGSRMQLAGALADG